MADTVTESGYILRHWENSSLANSGTFTQGITIGNNKSAQKIVAIVDSDGAGTAAFKTQNTDETVVKTNRTTFIAANDTTKMMKYPKKFSIGHGGKIEVAFTNTSGSSSKVGITIMALIS